MSALMKQLGIDRLSNEQRISLALEIWESLDEKPTGAMTEEKWAEISRRDREMDEGAPTLTWEEIRANVEKKR